MATDSGYVNQKKREDRGSEFVTLSPSGTNKNKYALDMALKGTVFSADSDLTEAGTTDINIVATAHLALPGDLIRFTTGVAIGQEQYVFSSSANSFLLFDNLTVTPGIGDGFDVLKPVTLTLGADGSFSGPVKFIRDGIIEDVTEDTGTPANNLPLPVKLVSVTGDINITANDLNVQTSHDAVNFDSMRIGDGTNLMAVNASLEAQVADTTARTSLAAILVDTTAIDTTLDVALSTRASEVTVAAILADTAAIDIATASIDASIDVALSTRASEVTAAAILADTAAIDTATASIDASIDVALSTRASEVTAAAILADTAAIDTATASIDASIDVSLSTRASEVTAAAILADTAAIDISTASLDTKLPSQGAALIAASTPVNIASDQVVAVSATALPLPTGAATEATLLLVEADTTAILLKLESSLSSTSPSVMAQQPLANTNDTALAASGPASWRSQSFFPSISGPVISAEFKLGRDLNLSGDMGIEIRTDDGTGKPSAIILDSIVIDVTTLPLIAAFPLAEFQVYDFNSTANLDVGTEYHFVLSNISLVNGGVPGNLLNIEYSSISAYVGTFRVSVDSGVTWGADIPTVDFAFKVNTSKSLFDVIGPWSVFNSTYVDASATSIPGNATDPLELVASTAADIVKLQFADTTGLFLEIMTGPATTETNLLIIGPGSDQTVEVILPLGTRISVRNLESASAIIVGSLAVNYIG